MLDSPESQVKNELEHKTAIFAGKVTKIIPLPQKTIISSADLVEVSFLVETVWKGDLEQQTIVYTAESSASCGYGGFEEGKSYIVSAYESSGKLETGMCELTKPLSMAEEELMLLGEGYAPHLASGGKAAANKDKVEAAVETDIKPELSSTSRVPLILAMAALLLIVIIVIILIRRRRNTF